VLNGAAGIACIVIDADVAPCPSCQSCVSGKTRQAIQREIKEKNRAQDLLANKYKSSTLSPDDIKLCLYSINDNNSFLTQSRDPVSAVPVCPLAHAFASLSAAWWVLCCAVPSRRVVWGGVAWRGVGWGGMNQAARCHARRDATPTNGVKGASSRLAPADPTVTCTVARPSA
jgi:hypothetical protein